ncbi:DNA protecting protein DprA [Candidatus Thiodiazotropha endoloripes]|nr:DNA protecting protein DprA [Candidatus Thiodiazotropha endoloripes]
MDDMPPNTSDTLDAWLQVSHTPGIGNRYFKRLIERFGSAEAILTASPDELAALSLPPATVERLSNPDPQRIETSLKWLEQPGHQAITLNDPDYPQLLREIDDPPAILYMIGNPELLLQPQLAVVGSRNPTSSGRDNAREFARFLAGSGFTICSGLALGIDTEAHRGALSAGRTLAVMGTGPDRIYPAKNQALAHQIAADHLLITEFPPGTPAKAENFPRRNRIISGLSLGVLVVEATLKSGSLITARLAAEQGREVFAIPGSIHNPQSKGCHALIRQGAKLVESAQDIGIELAPLTGLLEPLTDKTQPATPQSQRQTDPDYQRLEEALGYDPVSVDELITRTGLTPEAVSSMLLLLELEGHVSSAPGGYYSRVLTASRPSGRESK